MSRNRTIRAFAALIAVVCLPTAGAAASSTLLSGYGGPGQGNQAIIGSTLIGGSGGSSGGGSTGTSAGTQESTGTETPDSIALPKKPATHVRHRAARRRSSPRSAGASKPEAGKPKGAAMPRAVPAAARGSEAGTLGLTGADTIYIILAFLLLAATALLTTLLTGRAGRARDAGRGTL